MLFSLCRFNAKASAPRVGIFVSAGVRCSLADIIRINCGHHP